MRRIGGMLACLILASLLIGGCGSSFPPSGSSGCAGLTAASATAARGANAESDGFKQLDVTSHNPTLATSVLRDFCLTVQHPQKLSGTINCPPAFNDDYTGKFTDPAGKQIASYDWAANGCQLLKLTIGSASRSTYLFAAAATAAPNMDRDFARLIDAGCTDAIFSPPGPGRCE